LHSQNITGNIQTPPRTHNSSYPLPSTKANPQSDFVKLLGLLFQSNHSSIRHIKSIKAKCLRPLNLLKILAHPTKGCNRKTLLPLYQSFIRFVIDYGSPVYGLAPPSQLNLLEPVQNSALRIATGAFRTSPAISLCAETGIPPVKFRQMSLTANFLFTVATNPSLSLYHQLFEALPFKPNSSHIRHSLHRAMSRTFRYQCFPQVFSETRPWLLPIPQVDLELAKSVKLTTLSSQYRAILTHIINSYTIQ